MPPSPIPAQGSSEALSTSNVPPLPSQTNTYERVYPVAGSSTNQASLPATDSSGSPSPQAVRNLLADQRRRSEAEKRENDETAERRAKADAHQAAIPADSNLSKTKQATYAQQQRKRQQEAKLERERILRQIQLDKAERKEREEQRKALANAELEESDGVGGLANKQLSSELDLVSKPAGINICAIQVRMFDGSTIRNKFPADASLRTDVRSWVDEKQGNNDDPYTFKQILIPLPNRTLSISEEEESLQSLNLFPSATLVMVPVQGYTAAYAGNERIVSRGAAAGYNFVSAGAGLVMGALGTFLGIGQAARPAGESPVNENTQQTTSHSGARSATSGISTRTLHDQRESRESHQLYNGNQVSFNICL